MKNNEIILIKIGEIALKGLNRRMFEDVLKKNIKRKLKKIGDFKIKYAQSTMYIVPKDEDADIEKAVEALKKVFGISAFAKAIEAKKDIDDINQKTVEYLKEELSGCKTFKVEAKRSDKSFMMKSPEICAVCGANILENFKNLAVDVHNPDVVVTVEIRDFGAYIRGSKIKGAGGLPVGTGGKSTILISGGIDSPVAAWMMAKRGVKLNAVHFASPPYTSQRALKKVVDLLEKIAPYTGAMKMYCVEFTRIQEKIQECCPEELFTIIMRRLMMTIAEKIAIKTESKALITGESLGQVASQTIDAMVCTDQAVSMPVFRPLIGMDKEEIVSISRQIDTFELSIQPYEDCCTVFTPKHPKLKPVLKYVKRAQEEVDWSELIEQAIDECEVIKIGYDKK